MIWIVGFFVCGLLLLFGWWFCFLSVGNCFIYRSPLKSGAAQHLLKREGQGVFEVWNDIFDTFFFHVCMFS